MSTTRISLNLAPGWHQRISLPRVIPTSVHGALDYAASAFNLAAPSLLGLKDSPAASLMPRINGSAGVAYSLLTDYELGLVKAIPMPAHLALDAAKGALLASSPWLFGFQQGHPLLAAVRRRRHDRRAGRTDQQKTTRLRQEPGALSTRNRCGRHR